MLQLVAFICCTVTGWFATQAFVAHLTKTLLFFFIVIYSKIYAKCHLIFIFVCFFALYYYQAATSRAGK